MFWRAPPRAVDQATRMNCGRRCECWLHRAPRTDPPARTRTSVHRLTGVRRTTIPITSDNEHLLRSGYEARTEKELPVLNRWFPKDAVRRSVVVGLAPRAGVQRAMSGSMPSTQTAAACLWAVSHLCRWQLPLLCTPFLKVANPGEAAFLDLILYSREQIRIENAAMGEDSGSDAPWGIVSVKPQDVDHELPMQPITIMRNALGAEHGGSGVPLVCAGGLGCESPVEACGDSGARSCGCAEVLGGTRHDTHCGHVTSRHLAPLVAHVLVSVFGVLTTRLLLRLLSPAASSRTMLRTGRAQLSGTSTRPSNKLQARLKARALCSVLPWEYAKCTSSLMSVALRLAVNRIISMRLVANLEAGSARFWVIYQP